jgi:hypothetical protein
VVTALDDLERLGFVTRIQRILHAAIAAMAVSTTMPVVSRF